MKLFQDYLAYARDNPEGFWFKRKLFGWGWTPVTWQGWLVTGLYVVAVLFFALTIDENSPPREIMFTFILPMTLLSFTLIIIAAKTGEKPKWMWGLPKNKRNEQEQENKDSNQLTHPPHA